MIRKTILVIIILLCCVGCKDRIGDVDKVFNETINGHSNKENVISVDDAYSMISDAMGSLYDKIEYYDTVKYSLGEVENDYYAFLVETKDDSYYILFDIYNGVTFYVTALELGIKN